MDKKGPGLVFKKSLFFLFPFFALAASYLFLELFVLPINFFTYDVWGAAKVLYLRDFLPGFYYPRIHLVGIGTGDLANGSKWGLAKKTDFQTDEYGFRNSVEKAASSKIVIIGDSFAAYGLCSEEMFAGVLQRQLHENVYSMAPSDINEFLKQPAFQQHPPSIVILCCVERNLKFLPKPLAALPSGWTDSLRVSVLNKQWFQKIVACLDRLFKLPGWHHFYWKIHSNDSPKPLAAQETGPLLFLQGKASLKDMPDSFIDSEADVIERYQRVLKTRGIRFIALPVPNKESIYYQFLNIKKRPMYIHKLIKALKNRNIETLDLQAVFERYAERKKDYLYYPDDSHWNLAGIELAANGIVPIIKRLEPFYK